MTELQLWKSAYPMWITHAVVYPDRHRVENQHDTAIAITNLSID